MNSVKRRDIGIAGAIIVLAQAITSTKSSDSIKNQVDEMRSSFMQSRIDTEQFFVRKEELKTVVEKLDKMNIDIAKIGEQIKQMKDPDEKVRYNIYQFKKENLVERPI